MKISLKALLAAVLLSSASSSFAFWGNNNGWGNNWNPYDEWDPRYWMEEMENAFDNNDYGPGYGYGGPWGGGYPGYGRGYGMHGMMPQGGGAPYGYGRPPAQAPAAPAK